MDLPLLRKLQSMKRIENDPSHHFQTKTIDLATFIPMYPNVIVVDQTIDESVIDDQRPYHRSTTRATTNCATGPVKREFITNSLTRAIVAYDTFLQFERGWTIILREGLYINPRTERFPRFANSKVEIVGLKDVRFLYTMQIGKEVPMLRSPSLEFTLRNVRIYDFGEYRHPEAYTVDIVGDEDTSAQMRVDFVNVRIHAPYCQAICLRTGSMGFKDSTLTGCRVAAFVIDGCKFHFEDSSVSKMIFKCLSVHGKAKVTAVNTRFSECPSSCFGEESRGVFRNCRFEKEPVSPPLTYSGYYYGAPTAPLPPMAFIVNKDSELTCERSLFRDVRRIASAYGRNCRIILNHCVVSDCDFLGIAQEHSSLSITDCVINYTLRRGGPPFPFLLGVLCNVEGKVEFLRNKLGASVPRVFGVDKVSKKPKHDLEGVIFKQSFDNSPSTDKKQSKFTNYTKLLAQRLGDGFSVGDALAAGHYKSCQNCFRMEDFEAIHKWARGESAAKERFRYCGGCRKVAYCSEECKMAHWPDHRLLCKIKRSS